MDPATGMAIAGGAMQILNGLMAGDEESMRQFETLSPEQKQFVLGELSRLQQMQGPGGAADKAMKVFEQYLDPNSDVYKNFEKPYLQQFEQQTIPGISEQFAGKGALASSGFGQALSGAAANLQTNLAQMKTGLQRQAAGDIFGQYNQMANRATGTPMFGYQQRGANPLQTALGAGGQALMNAGLQGVASGWNSGGSKYPLTNGYANQFKTGELY